MYCMYVVELCVYCECVVIIKQIKPVLNYQQLGILGWYYDYMGCWLFVQGYALKC